jgi:hypothetical protein
MISSAWLLLQCIPSLILFFGMSPGRVCIACDTYHASQAKQYHHVNAVLADSSRPPQHDSTRKSQNFLAVRFCVFGKHDQIAVPGPVCCFQVDRYLNRRHIAQPCSHVLFGRNYIPMRWRVCRPQRREVYSQSGLGFFCRRTWSLVVEKRAVATKQLRGKIYGVIYLCSHELLSAPLPTALLSTWMAPKNRQSSDLGQDEFRQVNVD